MAQLSGRNGRPPACGQAWLRHGSRLELITGMPLSVVVLNRLGNAQGFGRHSFFQGNLNQDLLGLDHVGLISSAFSDFGAVFLILVGKLDLGLTEEW